MTDLIVRVVQFFISTANSMFTGLLPLKDMFSEVLLNLDEGLTFAYELLAMINFLVPIPTIFSILAFSLFLDMAMMSLFVVNWVIRRIVDAIP